MRRSRARVARVADDAEQRPALDSLPDLQTLGPIVEMRVVVERGAIAEDGDDAASERIEPDAPDLTARRREHWSSAFREEIDALVFAPIRSRSTPRRADVRRGQTLHRNRKPLHASIPDRVPQQPRARHRDREDEKNHDCTESEAPRSFHFGSSMQDA